MKEPVVEEMQRQVEHTNGVNGVGEKDDFNPSAQPPFKIAATRAAIPKNCWVKNPWSLLLSHFTRDEFAVFVLAAATIYFINCWSFWPLYWAAQRTMFWAIVVLGHDWRISLGTHPLNYGSVENEKSWVPAGTESKLGIRGGSAVHCEGRDEWVLLDYIGSLLSVLILLMLLPIRYPWSSMSSYRVSFNDNDTLQCPESSCNVQHFRVVELGSSVEGRGRDVEVSVGEGDREGRGRDGGRGGGGDDGGDGGDGGEGLDIIESGGGDMNWISSPISKLKKMSIMVTVQTTAASIGSRPCGQHSRIFLDCILVNDLVGYLCCMIAILLTYKKPRVAEILGWIGSTVVAFGFILLTTMFFVESRVC